MHLCSIKCCPLEPSGVRGTLSKGRKNLIPDIKDKPNIGRNSDQYSVCMREVVGPSDVSYVLRPSTPLHWHLALGLETCWHRAKHAPRSWSHRWGQQKGCLKRERGPWVNGANCRRLFPDWQQIESLVVELVEHQQHPSAPWAWAWLRSTAKRRRSRENSK